MSWICNKLQSLEAVVMRKKQTKSNCTCWHVHYVLALLSSYFQPHVSILSILSGTCLYYICRIYGGILKTMLSFKVYLLDIAIGRYVLRSIQAYHTKKWNRFIDLFVFDHFWNFYIFRNRLRLDLFYLTSVLVSYL